MKNIKTKLSFSKVNLQGGEQSTGQLLGVSLITQGDAIGHDLYIDNIFLTQLLSSISKKKDGMLKAKFQHASLFNDSMGKFLGKFYNVRIEGKQLVADLSLAKSAKKSPYGDLADYIMSLAQQSPDDFGISLQFELDVQQMQNFVMDNHGDMRVFEGEIQVKDFISPDKNNINNYPHARLANVTAGSIVDQPAANPLGLYARAFSAIKDQVIVIANLIRQEMEGKNKLGIIQELSKMNIKLEKQVVVEEKSVEQTETVINGESQIVNKEQNTVVTVEETPTEIIVETTTVETEKHEKPVDKPVVNQAVSEELSKESDSTKVMLSAKDKQIQTLNATVKELQAKLESNKELLKFAKGATPVAPSVEKEIKVGLRSKIESQLTKLNIK